jgi:hypothetical protein
VTFSQYIAQGSGDRLVGLIVGEPPSRGLKLLDQILAIKFLCHGALFLIEPQDSRNNPKLKPKIPKAQQAQAIASARAPSRSYCIEYGGLMREAFPVVQIAPKTRLRAWLT